MFAGEKIAIYQNSFQDRDADNQSLLCISASWQTIFVVLQFLLSYTRIRSSFVWSVERIFAVVVRPASTIALTFHGNLKRGG